MNGKRFEYHYQRKKNACVPGAGGVSLFAVQLAKALGARVIATSSNPENAARLREMGVGEVIDTRDLPE